MKRAALGLLLIAAGCGAAANPQQAKLDRTFDFVERTLRSAGRDVAAGLAFASQVELGGSPKTYLAASMPDNADFCDIEDGRPSHAWTVVVRPGPGKFDYTIDSYGADQGKPDKSAVVSVELKKRGASGG